MNLIDENLKKYATPTQWLHYTTWCEERSIRKTGARLGVHYSTIQKSMAALKGRAALKGYAPDEDIDYPIDAAHRLKGVSSLVRNKDKEDGSAGTVMQWFKTDIDKEQQIQAVMDAINAACDGITPVKPVTAPKVVKKDLLTQYTITDFHLGMYCWADETGEDWDIKIAEQVLMNAIGEMMQGSPNSKIGVYVQMGDLLHWDGLEAITPRGHNVVDADTRYDLLCGLAIDLNVSVTHELLKKHEKVIVFICEGNHDEAGSVWLRKATKKLFENEPRVVVDDTSFPFYAYLHGQTFLGYHHGHKVTNKSLPALFASEPRYRPMWGKATHTYIHSGHYHRAEQDKAEGGGAIVERHNTLAARDAFATRGGWVSERRTSAITYHKTKGERSRVIVTPEKE